MRHLFPDGLVMRFDSTIISLGEKDAAEVARLEAALFSMPWSEKQYRQLLGAAREAEEQGKGAFFQAFALRAPDGTLAAYVSFLLHAAAGELEICNIATAKAARRQGLAGRLLDHALAAAASEKLERAVLEVRESNVPALALYRSRAFRDCGRRKAYYSDTGEDALVLERLLRPSPHD